MLFIYTRKRGFFFVSECLPPEEMTYTSKVPSASRLLAIMVGLVAVSTVSAFVPPQAHFLQTRTTLAAARASKVLWLLHLVHSSMTTSSGMQLINSTACNRRAVQIFIWRLPWLSHGESILSIWSKRRRLFSFLRGPHRPMLRRPKTMRKRNLSLKNQSPRY